MRDGLGRLSGESANQLHQAGLRAVLQQTRQEDRPAS